MPSVEQLLLDDIQQLADEALEQEVQRRLQGSDHLGLPAQAHYDHTLEQMELLIHQVAHRRQQQLLQQAQDVALITTLTQALGAQAPDPHPDTMAAGTDAPMEGAHADEEPLLNADACEPTTGEHGSGIPAHGLASGQLPRDLVSKRGRRTKAAAANKSAVHGPGRPSGLRTTTPDIADMPPVLMPDMPGIIPGIGDIGMPDIVPSIGDMGMPDIVPGMGRAVTPGMPDIIPDVNRTLVPLMPGILNATIPRTMASIGAPGVLITDSIQLSRTRRKGAKRAVKAGADGQNGAGGMVGGGMQTMGNQSAMQAMGAHAAMQAMQAMEEAMDAHAAMQAMEAHVAMQGMEGPMQDMERAMSGMLPPMAPEEFAAWQQSLQASGGSSMFNAPSNGLPPEYILDMSMQMPGQSLMGHGAMPTYLPGNQRMPPAWPRRSPWPRPEWQACPPLPQQSLSGSLPPLPPFDAPYPPPSGSHPISPPMPPDAPYPGIMQPPLPLDPMPRLGSLRGVPRPPDQPYPGTIPLPPLPSDPPIPTSTAVLTTLQQQGLPSEARSLSRQGQSLLSPPNLPANTTRSLGQSLLTASGAGPGPTKAQESGLVASKSAVAALDDELESYWKMYSTPAGGNVAAPATEQQPSRDASEPPGTTTTTHDDSHGPGRRQRSVSPEEDGTEALNVPVQTPEAADLPAPQLPQTSTQPSPPTSAADPPAASRGAGANNSAAGPSTARPSMPANNQSTTQQPVHKGPTSSAAGPSSARLSIPGNSGQDNSRKRVRTPITAPAPSATTDCSLTGQAPAAGALGTQASSASGLTLVPGIWPHMTLAACPLRARMQENTIMLQENVAKLAKRAEHWSVVLRWTLDREPDVVNVDADEFMQLFHNGMLQVQTLVVGSTGTLPPKPPAKLFRPLALLLAAGRCGHPYGPVEVKKVTKNGLLKYVPPPAGWCLPPCLLGGLTARDPPQGTPPGKWAQVLGGCCPWWMVLDRYDETGDWKLLNSGCSTSAQACAAVRSGFTPVLGLVEAVPKHAWAPTALFLPVAALDFAASSQLRLKGLTFRQMSTICGDNRLVVCALEPGT